MRYTERHAGKAVIREKHLLSEEMEKLAKLEDLEETGRLGIPQAGNCKRCLMEGDYGECHIYGYGVGTREKCRRDCDQIDWQQSCATSHKEHTGGA